MNRIDAFIESCFKTLHRFEQQRTEETPRCGIYRGESAGDCNGVPCGKTQNLRFCTVCETWICEHCDREAHCTEKREHTYRK